MLFFFSVVGFLALPRHQGDKGRQVFRVRRAEGGQEFRLQGGEGSEELRWTAFGSGKASGSPSGEGGP